MLFLLGPTEDELFTDAYRKCITLSWIPVGLLFDTGRRQEKLVVKQMFETSICNFITHKLKPLQHLDSVLP
jgi:hypothetical protein